MMKFNIGDKVRMISHGSPVPFGTKGVIKKEIYNGYLVAWNGWNGGHTGYGCIPYPSNAKNCWWVESEILEIISSSYPSICISTDGKTTKATLRDGHTIIKTATSVCHPEDEFDYLTGAKIALERVMEKKEEQEELKKPKKFEIGMRVKDSRYNGCFDWGYVTHIRENNKYVFITPLDCMSDFLKNGAKEHENCFMIDEDYSIILKDKED